MSTADPRSILPPSSTALETAVDRYAPRWAELLGAIAHDAPAFQPWLAAEWQLTPLAPAFDTVEGLITHGLTWLMERGSAAAVLRVLHWLGFDAATLEEDGPFLHIDLGRLPAEGELARLAPLVRASIPAHVAFYRVVWVWDLRPIRLDHGPALDNGLLDDDSGPWIEPGEGQDPIKASFGRDRVFTMPPPAAGTPEVLRRRHHITPLTYDDRPMLDTWRLDSAVLVDGFSGRSTLYATTTAAPPAITPPRFTRGIVTQALLPAYPHPPAERARHATWAAEMPAPFAQSRAWRGRWQGTWRPKPAESRHTQLTE